MGLRSALENTASALWSDEHVWIKPITTQADLICAVFDLQLTEEQKELVNPAGFRSEEPIYNGAKTMLLVELPAPKKKK